MLNGLLCQANMLAGFVGHALSANIAALDMIDVDSQGNAGVVLGLTAGQMVGFNIPYWMKCLQVGSLVMLGRFSDADELLARLFQTDPADAEPLHQGIPHDVAVELAWFRNDTLAATRHAQSDCAASRPRRRYPYWLVRRELLPGSGSLDSGRLHGGRRLFPAGVGCVPPRQSRDWSSKPEYWHSRPTISCAAGDHPARRRGCRGGDWRRAAKGGSPRRVPREHCRGQGCV